jgi:hypothetical protein
MIRVRARWLDGRIDTLDPMESGVEKQEIRGLGPDLRWYSFYHSGEIDRDGCFIFVQHPTPFIESRASSDDIEVLSVQCFECGERLEIHGTATRGFGAMILRAVECPSCRATSDVPLPQSYEIVEIRIARQA